MRIVVDMQGVQTVSRFRGIGRYTLNFAKALVLNRNRHEIYLVLNGLFIDTIEPIRSAFDKLLPQENIRVFSLSGPVREIEHGNKYCRETAELLREEFIESLNPDVVHISSFFEGYLDDAILSLRKLGSSTSVSMTLFDLIPMANPEQFLSPDPGYSSFYNSKLESIRQAKLLLSISKYTKQEALEKLKIQNDQIINISTGINHDLFKKEDTDNSQEVLCRLGLKKHYILTAGSEEIHKNLEQMVKSFAALPPRLRFDLTLVIGGKFSSGFISELKHCATRWGLSEESLFFPGFIKDDDLICLYRNCKFFIFSSWHEGFGLPVLEAMACGAPVICSNTTSLPEVIGLSEATFNPFDVTSISAKMIQALNDEAFLKRLRDHGLRQAQKFSWDKTAKKAFEAWEKIIKDNAQEQLYKSRPHSIINRDLAKVLKKASSSLILNTAASLSQNQQNGLRRQLFLDVSELCQRDSKTGVQRVVKSYLKWLLQSPPQDFCVEPVFATKEQGYRYARRFTNRLIGQSEKNEQDLSIRWQRGDIFFGLDMQHHVQLAHQDFFYRLKQEGVTVKFEIYDLLPIQLSDYFKDANSKDLHEKWLTMIAGLDGAVCISKATANTFERWLNENDIFRSSNFQISWVHIGADIEGAHPLPRFHDDAEGLLKTLKKKPTILCVSTLEPRKKQQQILEGVEILWNTGTDINLVLVGNQGWNLESLVEKIRHHREKGKRLFWLEGISDEYLDEIYKVSTVLIAASLNEGFGLSLIEGARHELPLLVRDIPIFREVAGEHAFYFQGEQAEDLAVALREWFSLFERGEHPISSGIRWNTWQESSEQIKNALIAKNYPRKQLLVDVSELVQRDAKTGIQRVVINILREWLGRPPEGYRIEPVYATIEHGYCYARKFCNQIKGETRQCLPDEVIEYAPGDIFFGLDLQPQVQVAQRGFYAKLRQEGVFVYFTVYDLLSLQYPDYFPHESFEAFSNWLNVIAETDGAITISRETAEQLRLWLKNHGPKLNRPFKINSFKLGAHIQSAFPSHGLPSKSISVLKQLQVSTSFLMVGTLEPRKGHEQVLEAFERLWQEELPLNLVFVGKNGWMVEGLVGQLRSHPELNRRLFWLQEISDEYLEEVYGSCTCLIAASYGEGFGLPLIEAAQHHLPIIARDIPVFREVAGENAFFFQTKNPIELAHKIQEWIQISETGKYPRSEQIPWITWEKSAEDLLSKLILK